jgi:hypothetical protein
MDSPVLNLPNQTTQPMGDRPDSLSMSQGGTRRPNANLENGTSRCIRKGALNFRPTLSYADCWAALAIGVFTALLVGGMSWLIGGAWIP